MNGGDLGDGDHEDAASRTLGGRTVLELELELEHAAPFLSVGGRQREPSRFWLRVARWSFPDLATGGPIRAFREVHRTPEAQDALQPCKLSGRLDDRARRPHVEGRVVRSR